LDWWDCCNIFHIGYNGAGVLETTLWAHLWKVVMGVAVALAEFSVQCMAALCAQWYFRMTW